MKIYPGEVYGHTNIWRNQKENTQMIVIEEEEDGNVLCFDVVMGIQVNVRKNDLWELPEGELDKEVLHHGIPITGRERIADWKKNLKMDDIPSAKKGTRDSFKEALRSLIAGICNNCYDKAGLPDRYEGECEEEIATVTELLFDEIDR